MDQNETVQNWERIMEMPIEQIEFEIQKAGLKPLVDAMMEALIHPGCIGRKP